jgi:hypothetical protein
MTVGALVWASPHPPAVGGGGTGLRRPAHPRSKSDRNARIAATAIDAGLALATRNIGDFASMGVGLVNPFEREAERRLSPTMSPFLISFAIPNSGRCHHLFLMTD